jgi:hypothetical protein
MNAMPPGSTDVADPDSASSEHRFHSYVGSRIPWYVRLIWIGFWVFAIYYTITYLFPDLQSEIGNPP